MATYRMSAPDGQTYQIDGPDGASDDMVREQIIKQNPHLGGASPEPQSEFQRPPREGVLGAAINRAVRGGKRIADAIYPPAPAPPKGYLETAKDYAANVGSGLMEIASAPFAPLGEIVRPAGEALGRKMAMTPEEVDSDIAYLQAEKSRMMGDKTIMNISPQVIEQLDRQMDALRARRAKSLEQQAYEKGGDVAISAEMLGGAMFGKPFKFRGPVAAETLAAAFVPKSMRPAMAAVPKPLPPEKAPILDMQVIGKPDVSPPPRLIRKPFEEAPAVIEPQAAPEPFAIPREPEPAPLPTAAVAAQERTGGQIPPREPSPSPLVDAQGRRIVPTPEPGQGTAELRVSPPVEERPLPVPEQPRRLRSAGEVAEERAGGAVPPRVPTEPDVAAIGKEADRTIAEALGEMETPTRRLMKKGKGISGGSGDVPRTPGFGERQEAFGLHEDVGWVTPEGKQLSHTGVKSPESPYEMTHSEAISLLHGQKDLATALKEGWVRYVRSGNALNVETSLEGIPRAIEYISNNARSARGAAFVVDITDPAGKLIESKIFNRPYQALEYLKSKQAGQAPETLAKQAVLEQQTRGLLDELKSAKAEKEARRIRPAKPISGGSYGEPPRRTLEEVIDTVSSNVRHDDPQDWINNVRAALDDARLPQEMAPEVVRPFGLHWDTLLQDAKAASEAVKPTRPVRRAKPISGGSDLPVDQPLPSAREIGMRRKPAPEPVEEATPFDVPEGPAAAATLPEAPKTPLRREFGSEQKTPFTPESIEKSIKAELPEEIRNLVGSKRTPPGVAGRWKERLRRALPQEEFVNREAPNSPVVSEMAWHHAEEADRVHDLLKQPWMAKVKKLDPENMKQLEKTAVDLWDASDKTPAAFEKAVASWPEELKEYARYRNARIAEENLSRQRMKLPEIDELPGPYLPHVTDAELTSTVTLGNRAGGQGLQTSVKGAQEHRTARTMLEGEKGGISYIDPRNAILFREWNGIRMTQTERLMTALKNRALFETEEAAKAASKTGTAIPVTGMPGAEVYWAPSKAEALYLAQNIAQRPIGLQLPGRIGNLKTYSDLLFRNPNLVNPAPHITKNMWAKYILSSGDLNPGTIVRDGLELFRKPDLDTVKLFREYMPYADADPAYAQFQQALVKGPIENAFQQGLNTLALLNKPSSKVIFKWGDPAMRYSLFKKYLKQGKTPQEAANHAWVDLVNYGTRSDLVDFWKSIPMNFFVPWRVGSVTSVAKQIINHPVRAALVIGGIDLIREARYRETGRWTHLPWDYFEGPLVTAAEAVIKGDVSKLGFEAFSNAMFGPSGEATASNIKRMVTEPTSAKELGAAVLKVFWGLAQLFPSAEMATEFAAYQKDGKPGHLVNAIMALLVAERATKGFKPHSITSAIPESAMPSDYKVKYERLTNPANK